ncbi:hypothetical protein IS519_08900 [Vibrio crassostreae]|uniref:hypothetical protein n=1 Tax=Vibrio crassostreae TaxID=246167 RepID=UPI00200A3D4A|nr:hypothetical protein [Vibrio crassostreae]UPR28352.1 hypothetical protein IS519_08900 [Vibrio crassostreae]
MLEKLENRLVSLSSNVTNLRDLITPLINANKYICIVTGECVKFSYSEQNGDVDLDTKVRELSEIFRIPFGDIDGGFGARNCLIKHSIRDGLTEWTLDLSPEEDDLLEAYLCEQLLSLFRKLERKYKMRTTI